MKHKTHEADNFESKPFPEVPIEIKRAASSIPLSGGPSATGSSKAMLLRLFQSDLFTSSQAVFYLFKYVNEPGIQFYLCERLKSMPRAEIEFLIPQIW